MSDTGELLRLMVEVMRMDPRNRALILRAADEIEQTRRESAALRKTLQSIAEAPDNRWFSRAYLKEQARAALAQGGEGN